MARKKMTNDELCKAIEEAQKDPEFMKEIRKFNKAAVGIYKLK